MTTLVSTVRSTTTVNDAVRVRSQRTGRAGGGYQGHLRDLTMAGIFFESREPPSSEFSLADLKAAFPEGEYAVRAWSFDGTILVGSATFTHDVPAPPKITAPVIAQEPRGTRKDPVSRDDLVVSWDHVRKDRGLAGR